MKRMCLLAVLSAGIGSVYASTYYMKAGADDWSKASNFYTDRERTQVAAQAPSANDTVYLIGADTYSALDSNSASFDVFANLNEIWVLADDQGRFPKLSVTVTEGEKSVGFSYLYARSGSIVATNATLVKLGAGTLAFSRNTDERVCHASLDIREGALRLPQGGSKGTSHGFLDLAAGATLFLTGNPASAGNTSFFGIMAEAGSLMTNISTRANTLTVSDNPLLETGGYSVIAGRVGGHVRPWTNRNIAFLDDANTYVDDPYLAGNAGNFYSEEPWKNVGVYLCTKIGGDGNPSSLGKSSSIVFHVNGGGLRYLGTGERATRKFTLNSSAYPWFIDGGPTGNLDLASTLSLEKTSPDVRRFFFIGTNLQECVWSGAMNEITNSVGTIMPAHLTKAGSGTWRFADNPSRLHHGGTTIADGTLKFDSIAAKGEMCSLGYSDQLTADDRQAAANNAWVSYAFTLGGTNRAGIATTPVFAYNGATAAFVTNRPIALVHGGGTLRGSDNGGYLGFCGVSARDAGATPTLTLDGAAEACGCVGAISNGAANARVSVAKTGAGRWQLAGDLTFSGDLAVKAGTLDVVGALSKTNTYFRITIKGVGNGGSSIQCRQFALYDATGHRQNIGVTARTNEAARSAYATAIVRPAFDLRPGEAAYATPLSYKLDDAMPTIPDSDLDGLFTTVSSTSKTISHRYAISTAKKIARDDPSSWVVVVLRLKDDCPPITHFDIQQMNSGTSSCPKYVTVEGSSDGLSWQTLFDNTETGFDLEKGYLGYNAGDSTMCCYCLETGHTDGEAGCTKTSDGKHVVKGYGAPVGINKWISTGADASSVSVTAVRPYEEGVRCYAFAKTAQIDKFPADTVLPNVSYVSVAAGAVLNLPAGTTVCKLRVDATGAGTLRGATFAAKGTIDLVNLPADAAVALPGTYADCTGLANLANWQVTKGGKATRYQIRVSDGKLTVLHPGSVIVIR